MDWACLNNHSFSVIAPSLHIYCIVYKTNPEIHFLLQSGFVLHHFNPIKITFYILVITSTDQYSSQSGSSSGFFTTYPLGCLRLSTGGTGLSPSSTPSDLSRWINAYKGIEHHTLGLIRIFWLTSCLTQLDQVNSPQILMWNLAVIGVYMQVNSQLPENQLHSS